MGGGGVNTKKEHETYSFLYTDMSDAILWLFLNPLSFLSPHFHGNTFVWFDKLKAQTGKVAVDLWQLTILKGPR